MFCFFVMPNRIPYYSVGQTLIKLNLNNLRILQIFSNFSWIFPITFFLLPCKTEISGPDSSESFPNYTRIIFKSRILDLTEPNPNNSFVTMLSKFIDSPHGEQLATATEIWNCLAFSRHDLWGKKRYYDEEKAQIKPFSVST